MEINEMFLKGLAEKFNFLQNKYFTQCREKLNNTQRSDLKLFYSKAYRYGEIEDKNTKAKLFSFLTHAV